MKAEKSLDPYVQKSADAFLNLLKETYGPALAMTAVYGSAVTGGWVKGVSDINIIIVTDEADPNRLVQLSGKARRLISTRRITPHLLSRKELFSSSDIFPAEYLELRSHLQLLHGTNLFLEMEISLHNLRHQVESMLRGSVQTLRQMMIAAAGSEKLLGKALSGWSGSQTALFRALIRLADFKAEKGQQIPEVPDLSVSRELPGMLEQRFSIRREPLETLLRLREQARDGNSWNRLAADLQEQYLALLEEVDTYDAH